MKRYVVIGLVAVLAVLVKGPVAAQSRPVVDAGDGVAGVSWRGPDAAWYIEYGETPDGPTQKVLYRAPTHRLPLGTYRAGIGGLCNGTEYRFRVTNNRGELSEWSTATPMLTGTLPKPPIITDVEPGPGSLTVTWKPGRCGDRPPITNWTIQHKLWTAPSNDPASWTKIEIPDGEADSYTITDLENEEQFDVLHVVQVKAHNVDGDSGWSVHKVAAPEFAPPPTTVPPTTVPPTTVPPTTVPPTTVPPDTPTRVGPSGPSVRTDTPSEESVEKVTFTDLSETSSLTPHVEALARRGIFDRTECRAGRFCPDQPIRRWAAAVWLVRVIDGNDPPASTVLFTDVETGAWWARHVGRLAQLGVTKGCQPDRFCPDQFVTRAQMAVFLKRAFRLPAPSPAGFADTEGSFAEAAIDSLYRAGVTRGCAVDPLRFCPQRPTTRAQMAAFLSRSER